MTVFQHEEKPDTICRLCGDTIEYNGHWWTKGTCQNWCLSDVREHEPLTEELPDLHNPAEVEAWLELPG